MKQAILTKYIGPTNTKPSRIKAWCAAGSFVMPYKAELDTEANHRLAAKSLCLKLGWTSEDDMLVGLLPCNTGYVYIR